MGNTGSSGAGGASTAATATEKKTCYYELLAVEKSANQDEYASSFSFIQQRKPELTLPREQDQESL